MAFLTPDAVKSLGFSKVGENVLISEFARFYGVERIEIGNNVRIDDYAVISAGEGGVEIGSFVHVAVYSSIIGDSKVTLGDFSGLSSRVSIYSSSDDYSGESLTNPTVPGKYKNIKSAEVSLGRHVIIGCGSVILPGVCVGEGSAIGALSLVCKSCDPFGVYAGNPARKVNDRKKNFLHLEKVFLDSMV